MDATPLPCCNNFAQADSFGLTDFVVLLEVVEIFGVVDGPTGVVEMLAVVEGRELRASNALGARHLAG